MYNTKLEKIKMFISQNIEGEEVTERERGGKEGREGRRRKKKGNWTQHM